MLTYVPYEQRSPDRQYRQLLQRIIGMGVLAGKPHLNESALTVIGHQMRFNLSHGFPLITERDLVSGSEKARPQYQLAIAELMAFLNGAQTLEEMQAMGCGWWKDWVTEEKCMKRGLPPGDLGPGSYGAAFRRFPTSEGKPFDQITHLVEQIRELPHLRTHFVSPWIPQYIGRGEGKHQKVVVAPCHGWIHVFVFPESKTLSLHHFQRSGDVPVGVVFNLIQYASLTMMLAQVTGYAPGELVYTISDAHVYQGQINDVNDILARTKGMPLPTVHLDPTVDDLFAFRPEHFTVTDYHPQLGRRRIWTPV